MLSFSEHLNGNIETAKTVRETDRSAIWECRDVNGEIRWVIEGSADPRIPLPWTRALPEGAAFRSSRAAPG